MNNQLCFWSSSNIFSSSVASISNVKCWRSWLFQLNPTVFHTRHHFKTSQLCIHWALKQGECDVCKPPLPLFIGEHLITSWFPLFLIVYAMSYRYFDTTSTTHTSGFERRQVSMLAKLRLLFSFLHLTVRTEVNTQNFGFCLDADRCAPWQKGTGTQSHEGCNLYNLVEIRQI